MPERSSPMLGVMRQLASERGLNAAAMDKMRFEDVNAAIGIQLASESNEAAIDTIQLELIRQRYGEGTAVALEVLQVAAAGGLGKRLISALGRLGKGGGQQATGGEPTVGGGQGGSSGIASGAYGEPARAETYFRVEGGGSGSATSQNRIAVNDDGSITINPGCSGQLCVSVGSADHASYFLTNKRADGSVVVFEVDAGLHKQIMDSAIPQRPVPGVPRDPTAPKIVDPNKPGVALELPKMWESLLERNSSNARIYSHEDFLKEFGE